MDGCKSGIHLLTLIYDIIYMTVDQISEASLYDTIQSNTSLNSFFVYFSFIV